MIISLTIIIALIVITFLVFRNQKLKNSYQDYVNGKSSTFVLSLLLLLGIFLISIPLLVTQFSIIPLSYENTGEIGDIIGGSTAPFIGFIGIIVTFYAFWVQYQSNLNQRDDIRLERFENQYYEMLRLHKENVQEMEISNNINGRKCFVRMFDEFKYVYLSCYQMHHLHKSQLQKQYTKEKLCDLAYKIFFSGLESISELQLAKLIDKSNNELLSIIYKHLLPLQDKWLNRRSPNASVSDTIFYEDRQSKFEFEVYYYPFDGHNVRLGHYYRHLYQTVSFIADSEILPERKDKYKFLKLLRAQLSNHEQSLLYYNGLTTFGRPWISKGYFRNFKMIKNIPFDLVNFGVLPLDKIKSPNDYNEKVFEWE